MPNSEWSFSEWSFDHDEPSCGPLPDAAPPVARKSDHVCKKALRRNRTCERTGRIREDFADYLARGYLIAVLPISRIDIDYSPIEYPHAVIFHAPGFLEIEELNVVPNRTQGVNRAELASAYSGIDVDLLNNHHLVAFPCRFNWNEFCGGSHEGHLEFIRTLSAYVDRTCLNVIKFNFCRFGLADTIPGRAGTVMSNLMMAGALLYNHERCESRIIGGSVFSHAVVKGLGLPLQPLSRRAFPRNGEVGRIVGHGLELFASTLEASNPTLQFVQAISLLEYLADPFEFTKFQDVKRIIARYKATDQRQYADLLERFFELTAKVVDGTMVGYRTRIVHMGQRLEDIVPDSNERARLFRELQGYVGCVMEHMIKHSELDWADYVELRQGMKPFLSSNGRN